jgi:phospholipid N-methyltransferase
MFARMFFKYPAMLGSVWPSSDYLCSRLMRQINWQETACVVEYGPGVGTITRHVLRHLRPDGVLIGIEKNPELGQVLQRKFAGDHRFRLATASASEVRGVLDGHGIAAADCVISGIPFSLLPEDEAQRTMQATRASLSQHGKLLIYQFSDAVEPMLREHFNSVSSDFEIRNFLPARTYLACNI